MNKPTPEVEKCSEFLIVNGWERVLHEDEYEDSQVRSYCKDGHICVDLTADGDMVFIDDTGDFLHLPINYYALIGMLLENRQISAGYKSTHNP